MNDSQHVENIGNLIQKAENSIRSRLDSTYLSKNQATVDDMRRLHEDIHVIPSNTFGKTNSFFSTSSSSSSSSALNYRMNNGINPRSVNSITENKRLVNISQVNNNGNRRIYYPSVSPPPPPPPFSSTASPFSSSCPSSSSLSSSPSLSSSLSSSSSPSSSSYRPSFSNPLQANVVNELTQQLNNRRRVD